MRLRSTSFAAALSLVLLQLACAQHHGDFAALASQRVYDQIADTVMGSHPRSSGRACFSFFKALLGLPDNALARAIEAALSPYPDANALLMVKIEDHGMCVDISGVPGQME